MPYRDIEVRREKDRIAKATKRAAMTPEERSAARKQHDETYRNNHREERRSYDRDRWERKRST